jgi:hypothetical protein
MLPPPDKIASFRKRYDRCRLDSGLQVGWVVASFLIVKGRKREKVLIEAPLGATSGLTMQRVLNHH